jgi:hypothetical protein
MYELKCNEDMRGNKARTASIAYLQYNNDNCTVLYNMYFTMYVYSV